MSTFTEDDHAAEPLPEDIYPLIGYFVHRKCTPSWIIKKCVTDGINVIYVISGKATFVINNESHRVKQGDLLCIPTNSSLFAFTHAEDLMECYSVAFKLLDGNGQIRGLPLPLVNHIGIFPEIISLFANLNNVWLRQSVGYDLEARANMMLIILRFYKLLLYDEMHTITDNRINDAIRYITDNYASDIHIEDLAALSKLNPHYFGVLFQKSTGMTFRQYLTAIRVNNAEMMLKHHRHSIGEIAEICGFSDACYFSRVYKKARGVSPSKV
ncbi:MAG: AraC family transcriptional regulator [Lachnospiraceae bacterium]|jgi:AraC-like DNA-binding protein|nr:AraC family transcriptional regulator [Lachnospiraceae bacterium]